ncbi:unnamed protein product [Cunninghamella blakesleeana]
MKKNQRNSMLSQKPNYSTLFHYARRFDDVPAEQQYNHFDEDISEEIDKERKHDHPINSKCYHYIKKKKIPPPPSPPTIQQIDIVRYSWERVCELRLDEDDPHMSPAQGFGAKFYEALFEKDEIYKEKFSNNVILQARVLADIISFLTRSPSIKGESGSIQDINATKKQKLNEHQPPSPCSVLSFVELVEHTMNDPVCHDLTSFIRRNSATNINYGQNNDVSESDINCSSHYHSYSQFVLPPSPTSSIDSENGSTYIENNSRFSFQQLQEIEYYMLKKQQLEHDKENQFFAYKSKELGASHLKYGLLPYHFDAIASALITALRTRLRDECVSHVENAWLKAYEFTGYHMKVGLAAQIANDQEHQLRSSISLTSLNSLDVGESKCTIQ